MTNIDKRLNKLDAAVQAMPLRPGAEDEALAHFKATGELPAHEKLAQRVVRGALRLPHPVSHRERLFLEATSDQPFVREPARFVLRALVHAGQDIGSRNLLDEDMELPKCGTLALHLMGWPECLVRPPYEAQATRVLRDHEELRSRRTGSSYWMQKLAEAGCEFFKDGTLPADADLRDETITYAEILALHQILGGEEDTEVLAAFERVATTTGDERETAIRDLQSLASNGRVP